MTLPPKINKTIIDKASINKAGIDKARIDKDLAFLLRFENIAWFDIVDDNASKKRGRVRILDRRVYPMSITYVDCYHHKEVATAIKHMVTQSGGPLLAVTMGMVLAAYETKGMTREETLAYLKKAALSLGHARPTTASRMLHLTEKAYRLAKSEPWEDHKTLIALLQANAISEATLRYQKFFKVATYLAKKVPPQGTVMTYCFAETVIGMLCLILKKENKRGVKFICPETRPFLQGARLTASVIYEMGFKVHVITDNMVGCILKEKKVDLFTTAADMITQDGYIVNKVGTFQIALLAHHFSIPYVVTGAPSSHHKSLQSIAIEERDGREVLSHLGKKVTLEGVEAYYPAFDITPPHLCSSVITEKGVYSPFALSNYFKN